MPLFKKARFDAALEEEMRLHLETRAAELIAGGLTEPEAWAQARREFGSPLRMAEESRAAWGWTWLDDLWRDARHAVRALRRDWGFTAVAVASLALGIGVNTLVFSLTAEFLFSEPSVREPGTLAELVVGGDNQIPIREYRFLRDAGVFEGLAGANPMQEANWRAGETTRRLFVTRVTDNLFSVTGTPLLMGRGLAKNDVEAAVVSHRFWRTRLEGDPAVLGRALALDGRPHTIVGVLPETHRTLTGFGYSPDLYLPITLDRGRVALYGRLPSGVDHAAARERLRAACAEMDRVFPDGNRKWSSEVAVNRLAGIDRLRGGFLPTVSAFFAVLMGAVALLLLIACVNVAGLLLARSAARAQEFAIRMSIGAGRGRLIRQLLTESLLLALAGAAAGVALNLLSARLMNRAVFALPFPVKLSIQPDLRLLLYASAVAVAAAVVSGLLPALRATAVSAAIKSGERQVSGRGRLRAALVAGQLAVSVVMLALAALSVRNLTLAARLDPGFDLRRTAWAQVRLVPESYPTPEAVRAEVSSTLDRLRATPGVASASVAYFVPLNDHFSSRAAMIYSDLLPRGERIEHAWNAVTPDYFATMAIPVLRGREFTAGDREGAPAVAVVNEAMSRKLFGAADPVGRRIRIGERAERIVVGVARNSKYSTLGEVDRPALFEPWLQLGGGRATLNYLVRAAGSPAALVRPLNAALLEADPASAIEVKLMSDATAFALLPSRAGAYFLGAIGLLGLALAAVGLYGALAYSTSRRTREIGVRIALGATRGRVLRLVFGEGFAVVGGGLALGLAAALAITRPLARFLIPGLSPSDPTSYAAVCVVLAAVGAAAALRPALRAARIDPMQAIRYE